MNDHNKKKHVAFLLNAIYTTRLSMRFKIAIRQFFTSRLFTITTQYSDYTKIDFYLNNPEWTLPWDILPDSALDANGFPIRPEPSVTGGFDGGYGSGNYRADRTFKLPTLQIKQVCRMTFTSISGSGSSSSYLVCWSIP